MNASGNHSNLHMEEDPGVISKKDKPDNPLKVLYQRLDEERHALVRQLNGMHVFTVTGNSPVKCFVSAYFDQVF